MPSLPSSIPTYPAIVPSLFKGIGIPVAVVLSGLVIYYAVAKIVKQQKTHADLESAGNDPFLLIDSGEAKMSTATAHPQVRQFTRALHWARLRRLHGLTQSVTLRVESAPVPASTPSAVESAAAAPEVIVKSSNDTGTRYASRAWTMSAAENFLDVQSTPFAAQTSSRVEAAATEDAETLTTPMTDVIVLSDNEDCASAVLMDLDERLALERFVEFMSFDKSKVTLAAPSPDTIAIRAPMPVNVAAMFRQADRLADMVSTSFNCDNGGNEMPDGSLGQDQPARNDLFSLEAFASLMRPPAQTMPPLAPSPAEQAFSLESFAVLMCPPLSPILPTIHAPKPIKAEAMFGHAQWLAAVAVGNTETSICVVSQPREPATVHHGILTDVQTLRRKPRVKATAAKGGKTASTSKKTKAKENVFDTSTHARKRRRSQVIA